MKKAAVVLLVFAFVLVLGSSALAAQPSQGKNSTEFGIGDGRNLQGFGGGPHCHLLTTSGHYGTIVVYPSHTGHASSEAPIIADADPTPCDGIAGN